MGAKDPSSGGIGPTCDEDDDELLTAAADLGLNVDGFRPRADTESTAERPAQLIPRDLFAAVDRDVAEIGKRASAALTDEHVHEALARDYGRDELAEVPETVELALRFARRARQSSNSAQALGSDLVRLKRQAEQTLRDAASALERFDRTGRMMGGFQHPAVYREALVNQAVNADAAVDLCVDDGFSALDEERFADLVVVLAAVVECLDLAHEPITEKVEWAKQFLTSHGTSWFRPVAQAVETKPQTTSAPRRGRTRQRRCRRSVRRTGARAADGGGSSGSSGLAARFINLITTVFKKGGGR